MLQKRLITILLIALFSLPLFASPSPQVMLKTAVHQLTLQLDKHQKQLKSSPRLISHLVTTYILPKVDVDYMARYVVGHYWRKATSLERQQFKQLFIHYVVADYSQALSFYQGDQVYFYPLRGRYTHKKNLDIYSMIKRKNGQIISLTYSLHRQKKHWSINNFTIENVSMIDIYRSQFSDTLSQGGMSLLIKTMIAKARR